MVKIEKRSEERTTELHKPKSRKINRCINHPEKRSIRYCEQCDEPFCNECVTEYWSHNFISYAYLGETKKFSKEYLCHACSAKKRRKGVFMASLLLIILFLFIGFSIFNA